MDGGGWLWIRELAILRFGRVLRFARRVLLAPQPAEEHTERQILAMRLAGPKRPPANARSFVNFVLSPMRKLQRIDTYMMLSESPPALVTINKTWLRECLGCE